MIKEIKKVKRIESKHRDFINCLLKNKKQTKLFSGGEDHNICIYYHKLPGDIENLTAFIVDPVLGSGKTINLAIDLLKENGCKNIKVLCILALDWGIKVVQDAHPDVDLYISAIDKESINDENGNPMIMVPGVGDASERMFGN